MAPAVLLDSALITSDEEITTIPGITPARLDRRRLAVAQKLLPQLSENVEVAKNLIEFEADADSFKRYKQRIVGPASSLEHATWGKGESFIADFEGHRAGYLSFFLDAEGESIDAPARLKLTFGEVPSDVTEQLSPCHSWISTSWIPEEIITVDWLPVEVKMPRRYAFRYVKVEIIDTSCKYRCIFKDFRATAVSSVSFSHVVSALKTDDQLIHKIDETSIRTLRNCMQTVFEDGPRRDQRLWLGDLRLQAQASYASLSNAALVKRCLYLFAAFEFADGRVPASVFEKPHPRIASDYILDYELLLGSIVLDYVLETKDYSTGRDLWPAVLRSLRNAASFLDDDGILRPPEDCWVFIDWNDNLERTCAIQGVYVFALRCNQQLADLLDIDVDYSTEIERTSSACRLTFWDEVRAAWVSGTDRQVSWSSQAWMSIAQIEPPNKSNNNTALLNALADPHAIPPKTPYAYHYVVEAFLEVGDRAKALQLIKEYWGDMIDKGVDCFWEAWDADDVHSGPYHDYHNNSHCHAWSCTPTYFLRRRLSALTARNNRPTVVARGPLEQYRTVDTKQELPKQSQTQSSIENWDALKFPPRDVLEEVLEAYMCHVHDSAHSLFHPPTLRREFLNGELSIILQYLIISLGSRFSRSPWFDGQPVRDRGKHWYIEGKRLLTDQLDDFSILTIQCCVLTAYYANGQGDGQREALYNGIAIRIAQIMKLDRPDASLDLQQEELRTRIWWSLYIADRWNSGAVGVSQMITMDSLEHVKLPMEEERYWSLSNAEPLDEISAQPQKLGLWGHMATLSQLFSKVMAINSGAVQGHKTNLQQDVEIAEQAFQDWHTALPQKYKLSLETLLNHTRTGTARILISLHLAYHHYLQLLYYQFLDGDMTRTQPSTARAYANRCEWHACKLTETMQLTVLMEQCDLLSSVTGHVLVISSSVHLHALLTSGNAEARARLTVNFEILTKIRPYWPVIDTSIARLRIFQEACMERVQQVEFDSAYSMNQWLLKFLMEPSSSLAQPTKAVKQPLLMSTYQNDMLSDNEAELDPIQLAINELLWDPSYMSADGAVT